MAYKCLSDLLAKLIKGKMLSKGVSMKPKFVETRPNIWADDLPEFEETVNFPVKKHEEMKQSIRRTLLKKIDDPSKKLKLIDIIQRLGVAYHFKTEIENELTKIWNINFEEYYNDLYNVALHFRLLRQQGFRVSCDVFLKFLDKEGKFSDTLNEDARGLLNLYEAAFLGTRGEPVLDEAIVFTSKKLQILLPNISPNIAEEVSHALKRPIHKNMPRLEARHFIGIYEADESHNKTLAKFAKSDFNMLQVLHQKELKDVLEWWKHWDFTNKLPYARERTWETHCWMVGAYFEPQYSEGRKLLTKLIALFTVLDDTFDNFGKTEELESFTQATHRWEIGAIDALPEYLQLLFRSLMGLINEIEEIAIREGKPFYSYYAREFISEVVENYLREVKWSDAKYVPTIDEYMKVCTVSSCYPMMTTISFIGMGNTATKEAFEWISNNPKCVEASAVICRLMDDIVDHKFELESRDDVASAVKCYTKRYKTSELDAIEKFKKDIENAWKDINEECLRPLPVAMDLLERVLNLTRVMDVFYKDDDPYSNPLLLKDVVAAVLKDPLF